MQNNFTKDSELLTPSNNLMQTNVFNKIFDGISNKLTNFEGEHVQNIKSDVLLPPVLTGSGETTNSEKSTGYSIFGYEFSFWTLILLSVVLATIIYFVYKWIYGNKNQIVSIQKSKNIIKNIEVKPLVKEENDNDTSSESESESDSDSETESEIKTKNNSLTKSVPKK